MIIGIEVMFLLIGVTYGGNFLLYRFFKRKQEIQGMEKLAILFGINMLILLLDSALIVLAVLIEKGAVS
ncbi:hypothetical protein [Enterococcus sp. BWR-S5]|uniref:hypothetical protein n=1 Tax=Enterococcus sp. BWR-S5 TaxID=2787714 RepID=UPI001F25A7C2|nr:hypothetical protein [Enterococcus sp. BWR-S5]